MDLVFLAEIWLKINPELGTPKGAVIVIAILINYNEGKSAINLSN